MSASKHPEYSFLLRALLFHETIDFLKVQDNMEQPGGTNVSAVSPEETQKVPFIGVKHPARSGPGDENDYPKYWIWQVNLGHETSEETISFFPILNDGEERLQRQGVSPLSDEECLTHLERLITSQDGYPWSKINDKIIEGHALGNLSDEEVSQWDHLQGLYFGHLVNGQEWLKLPERPCRALLNDLLWWGIAIDFCCNIEEMDAVVRSLGKVHFGLLCQDLGIIVTVPLKSGDEAADTVAE